VFQGFLWFGTASTYGWYCNACQNQSFGRSYYTAVEFPGNFDYIFSDPACTTPVILPGTSANPLYIWMKRDNINFARVYLINELGQIGYNPGGEFLGPTIVDCVSFYSPTGIPSSCP
jgi:hypothetical protein